MSLGVMVRIRTWFRVAGVLLPAATVPIIAGAGQASVLESWRCRATTGTAYEYDGMAAHWQTRVFSVDQDWRIERRLAGQGDDTEWQARRITGQAAGAAEVLGCRRDERSLDRRLLLCGPGGQVKVDFDSGLISIGLATPVPAARVAATAVGACRAEAGVDSIN